MMKKNIRQTQTYILDANSDI